MAWLAERVGRSNFRDCVFIRIHCPRASHRQLQLIGVNQRTKDSIQVALVQEFALQPGRWHVQFIGDQTNDEWEMRVSGPGIETAEYLDGRLGQHEADFIASALRRIIEDAAP